MRKRDLVVSATFCALLVGAYLVLNSNSNQAPKMTMTDTDNNVVTIPSNGKYSLVTFWATTCVGCQKEVPHLIELQTTYGADTLNIAAIAMSYDPAEQVANFRQQHSLNYPIVLDSDGAIAKDFGDVNMTPTTYLIDEKGNIVYHKVGEFDTQFIKTRITGS